LSYCRQSDEQMMPTADTQQHGRSVWTGSDVWLRVAWLEKKCLLFPRQLHPKIFLKISLILYFNGEYCQKMMTMMKVEHGMNYQLVNVSQ
jgi:hypothetical protein